MTDEEWAERLAEVRSVRAEHREIARRMLRPQRVPAIAGKVWCPRCVGWAVRPHPLRH